MNTNTILSLLEQYNLLLSSLVSALDRIGDFLEQRHPVPLAPNYQLSLERWQGFDWASIGATVERVDSYGAAVISWRGQMFVRRSPANKFEAAIWFSRCTGKDERGENQYERLCTFKPVPQAEPLPERVMRLVR